MEVHWIAIRRPGRWTLIRGSAGDSTICVLRPGLEGVEDVEKQGTIFFRADRQDYRRQDAISQVVAIFAFDTSHPQRA
jgi:hypothetical protein